MFNVQNNIEIFLVGGWVRPSPEPNCVLCFRIIAEYILVHYFFWMDFRRRKRRQYWYNILIKWNYFYTGGVFSDIVKTCKYCK